MCGGGKHGPFNSWAELVQHWKGSRSREEELKEHERFRRIASLGEAIKIAGLSRDEKGNLYSHQWKPGGRWPQKLEIAARALAAKSNADLLRQCSTFAKLHMAVGIIVNEMAGAFEDSPLYVYDVSVRIVAHLGRDLPGTSPATNPYWPDRVYLHRGTREGAQVLQEYKVLIISGDTLEMSDLPTELQQLDPWEVESILCDYADDIRLMGERGLLKR
jgi:hypothetical protein